MEEDDSADTPDESPIPLAAINPSLEALRLLHRPRIDHNGYHLDFFNFSNDHLYERLQPRKVTLRQTGAIELKHAGPATKLQMPFVSQVSPLIVVITHAFLHHHHSISWIFHEKIFRTGIDRRCSSRPVYRYASRS